MSKAQGWIVIALTVVVFGAIIYWTQLYTPIKTPGTTGSTPIATASYACDNGHRIVAAYYKGAAVPPPAEGQPPTPTGHVEVSLDGGPTTTLAQTISADGARYSDGDPQLAQGTPGAEMFVFWSKGDSAFIMRGNSMDLTYTNCAIPPAEETTAAPGLECHSSSKFFAIQKSLTDSVGSNILIKYKTDPNQNFPCEYTAANGDFELQNVLAEYFLTFTDNFLVLDRGTAPPPRGLIVYDLSSRKIVFTDSYTKPVTVSGDRITYWSKTNQKPTLQNCPNLNDYTSNGLGAVIMSKVTVDLATLSKKATGEFECLATQ